MAKHVTGTLESGNKPVHLSVLGMALVLLGYANRSFLGTFVEQRERERDA